MFSIPSFLHFMKGEKCKEQILIVKSMLCSLLFSIKATEPLHFEGKAKILYSLKKPAMQAFAARAEEAIFFCVYSYLKQQNDGLKKEMINMKALITGATSGIGRDMAALLSHMGYDLIIASRNTHKMKQVQKKLPTAVEIITVDLCCAEDCYQLYEAVKEQEIDIVINNAGFGAFGPFSDIALEKELDMIDLNIKAVHILTKLFIKYFKERNKGYLLNVASSAAFLQCPLMATYYATKAYVLRLTEAVRKELEKEGSAVKISVLCPGPVDTAFCERANVSFQLKGMKSKRVAKYAIEKMLKGQMIIIPGKAMQLARIGERFLPERALLCIAYHIQHKKG